MLFLVFKVFFIIHLGNIGYYHSLYDIYVTIGNVKLVVLYFPLLCSIERIHITDK